MNEKKIITELNDVELKELENCLSVDTYENLFKGEETEAHGFNIDKVKWINDNWGNGNSKVNWFTLIPYSYSYYVEFATFVVDLKECGVVVVGKEVREVTKKWDFVTDEVYFNDTDNLDGLPFEIDYLVRV